MPALVSPGSVSSGRVLGRYELLLPIATGGMATVWAARLRGSRGFQKIVAIKTIRAEMAEDPEFADMLLDEASLASRIRHPQVVEILDLGDHEGVPYIVMEWIDGEPIHVVINEAAGTGGVPLPVCVRLGTQLCAGLHAAHELRSDEGELVGLVHRDVSPQNVLVTWDGVAKLVDFGIAKATGRAVGQTVAGRIKGKTAYLAPEQVLGEAVDRRTDIFAAGTLLYAMTTGTHPFRGRTDVDTLGSILSEKAPPRPGKVVAGFPPQLEKVIMTALEKDPARRYQTANEMLRELDRALPSNKRVSTDEEVASYVRPLLAPRFEALRAKIKEALRLADERIADDARRSFTSETTEAPVAPSVRTGVRVRRADSAPDPGDGEGDSFKSGVVGRVIPRQAAPGETVPAAPFAVRALSSSTGSLIDTAVPPPPPAPELDGEPPAPASKADPEPVTAPDPVPGSEPATRPHPATDPEPGADSAGSEPAPGPASRRRLGYAIAGAVLLLASVLIVVVSSTSRRPAHPAALPDPPQPAAVEPQPSAAASSAASSQPTTSSEPQPSSAPPPQVSATSAPQVPLATARPPGPPGTGKAPPKPKPYKPTTI